MVSKLINNNEDIIQMKCTIEVQKSLIDELSSEMTNMKVNFEVEKVIMARKMGVLRHQNEVIECRLKDIEADSSDYKLKILQFKALQNRVDKLLAEKDSFIQLKEEMADLMKSLKSAKEHNDRPMMSLALDSENNQIVAKENVEDNVKQISADQPTSNVDNDYEIVDVVPLQDIIASVPEENISAESTDHRPIATEEPSEYTVFEDFTNSTTPVGVEKQKSITSMVDVDYPCPVIVAPEMSSANSSKTTVAAAVDVKGKEWSNMLDEMEKERSINGLQKPCEGLHRDELPVNSYTQLDETEECLVDCHMTGRTVGAHGPTETVAEHAAKRSVVDEQPENPGEDKDKDLEKVSGALAVGSEHAPTRGSVATAGKAEADGVVTEPTGCTAPETEKTSSTTEIAVESKPEKENRPGNGSDDVLPLSASEPMGEDAISTDNAFRRLLSSTNPCVRKLKELDVLKNPKNEWYVDFLDQIAIEEELTLSYESIDPEADDDCCVRLTVSPIEWTTECFAKSLHEAQVLTAYNCLVFIKNYKM